MTETSARRGPAPSRRRRPDRRRNPRRRPPRPSGPPPARPSWAAVGGRSRRGIDIKLVIAVLIGLVLGDRRRRWRSSSAIAGEHAVDKDRQAIAETVILEQSRADSEVILQDARSRFADHAIAVVNAGAARAAGRERRRSRDEDADRQLRDEAVELRAVARRVLEGTLGPVLARRLRRRGRRGGRPTFDEAALADDLERIATIAEPDQPGADRARGRPAPRREPASTTSG